MTDLDGVVVALKRMVRNLSIDALSNKVALDVDANGKWITVHPNDSDKGRHIHISGRGEIDSKGPLSDALKSKGGGVNPENNMHHQESEFDRTPLGAALKNEREGGKPEDPSLADPEGKYYHPSRSDLERSDVEHGPGYEGISKKTLMTWLDARNSRLADRLETMGESLTHYYNVEWWLKHDAGARKELEEIKRRCAQMGKKPKVVEYVRGRRLSGEEANEF